MQRPSHRMLSPSPAIVAAVAAVIGISPAVSPATNISWSGATSTAWTTGGNWDGGAPPASSNADAAVFNKTSYANQPNAGTRTVGGIQIGDGTTAAAPLTISGTLLTLGASGVGTGITIAANAGAVMIDTPLGLGANQSWTNNSSNVLTVNGAIQLVNRGLTIAGTGDTILAGVISASSSGTLIKSGSGTLRLQAANDFGNLTTVNGGTLKLDGGSLKSGNGLTTSTGGIFELNGQSQVLGKVINGATITNSNTSLTPTLTIGSASTGAGTYSGRMNVIWNQADTNSTITGGFGHTGNLTLNANGTGSLSMTMAAVNNVGAITNSGSGVGVATLGIIGEKVTGVVQNSATSTLRLGVGGGSGSGSPNWSSGLAIQSGTVEVAGFANAAGSADNVIQLGDSATGANVTLATIGSTTVAGQITVAAGAGSRTIQNSAAPSPTFGGLITLLHDVNVLNSSGANSASGMSFTGGITGTGNVSVSNNSAVAGQGINFTTTSINPTGSFTNTGTGSNATVVTAEIGPHVTGVTQDSTTSALILAGSHTYLASTTVSHGTLQLGQTIQIDANTTQAQGGSLANGNIGVAAGASFVMDNDASSLAFNIADAGSFDRILNEGTATLRGTVMLNFASPLADGVTLDLFQGGGNYLSSIGAVGGTGAYAGAYSFDGANYQGDFGSQRVMFNPSSGDVTISAVPEPMALAGVAMGLSLLLRRRRRV